MGYNVWKNLEVYTYLEFHILELHRKVPASRKTFEVNQAIGINGDIFPVWRQEKGGRLTQTGRDILRVVAADVNYTIIP